MFNKKLQFVSEKSSEGPTFRTNLTQKGAPGALRGPLWESLGVSGLPPGHAGATFDYGTRSGAAFSLDLMYF